MLATRRGSGAVNPKPPENAAYAQNPHILNDTLRTNKK